MPDDTGNPYLLPYPEASDVANVPLDMQELADRLVVVLNGKLSSTSLTTEMNKRIVILPVGSAMPPTAPDGAVLFLYSTTG